MQVEHRNEVLRVADLTVTSPTIEEAMFVNCRLVGPAFLAIIDAVQLRSCTFDTAGLGLDAVLWEVDPPRPIVGATGLRAVCFEECRFEGVGFMATRPVIAMLRADLTGATQ